MSYNPSFADALGYLVRLVVRAASGLAEHAVRPANQAAPTGVQDTEFATIMIDDVTASGWPDVNLDVPTEDDGTEVLYASDDLHHFTASVQFFRTAAVDTKGLATSTSDAYSRAARLPRQLLLPASLELMGRFGLGFEGASKPRNLAAIARGGYESRGQVDLMFNIATREEVTLAALAGAQMVLKVAQAGGQIDTRTIEVTP